MNISFSPIAKYDTISLQQSANSTATKLTFPDQPQLRGKKICGIEMPYVGYDLNGATTVNTTAETYNNAFITLFFEGIEGIYRMPLLELVYIFTAQSNRNFDGIYSINDKEIIWTKSYITLSSPTTPATNVVWCLGVYYR